MLLNELKKILTLKNNIKIVALTRRHASKGCIDSEKRDLNVQIKHDIEKHWRTNLGCNRFDLNKLGDKEKFYVLSMFPYPSGNLHMGHVRVYTISDAMARFYRLNGYHVLHPMGWDSFGLPAENAALERKIPADKWTIQNIAHMREQLKNLGCSFDWSREVTTCMPDYYRWTQSLFLKMHKAGLAYQKEALVNWDPVDKTVLADEQVDENQCSWRSGAKVEKKLLKQWFIRTTKFAKPLLDGLDDPSLVDWRDIINLQKHWIGDCNGYSFDLNLKYPNESSKLPKLKSINVWTENPEYLPMAAFVAITKDHILNKTSQDNGDNGNVSVVNIFDNNNHLPVIVTDEIEFPAHCDTYLGIPALRETDRNVAEKLGITFKLTAENNSLDKTDVLKRAHELNIGGYLVSSKLKDWLISRQRYWGTPIPIVHCQQCGAVPVNDEDLPVRLADSPTDRECPIKTACPKCGNKDAVREMDTMDTFVDSSWYFLRYLDPANNHEMFDPNVANAGMPVDLYIGGKEHAVLHMYYARFVNHFLHSIGLVPQPEPFRRLLVQGMVMGRSYRSKNSGKYLSENEVDIINEKKNQAKEKSTGKPVLMQWEKMSKSKYNGVDPEQLIDELSCDTVRLILLGDVAPTSHRNWSRKTFPGLLNWQNRLWLTLNDFNKIRRTESKVDAQNIITSPEFMELEAKMFDSRNYFIKGTTFNYKFSHQLSVAISKMQGLTTTIRRATPDQIRFSKEYELALGNLLIMLSPMAPHFGSELWSQFLAAPNRLNAIDEINWNSDVLQQRWPIVHKDYQLDLLFKVNGMDAGIMKFTTDELAEINHEKAIEIGLQNTGVQSMISGKAVIRTSYVHYPACGAIAHLFLEFKEKQKVGVNE